LKVAVPKLQFWNSLSIISIYYLLVGPSGNIYGFAGEVCAISANFTGRALKDAAKT
jgi:hypothetical protein